MTYKESRLKELSKLKEKLQLGNEVIVFPLCKTFRFSKASKYYFVRVEKDKIELIYKSTKQTRVIEPVKFENNDNRYYFFYNLTFDKKLHSTVEDMECAVFRYIYNIKYGYDILLELSKNCLEYINSKPTEVE